MAINNDSSKATDAAGLSLQVAKVQVKKMAVVKVKI